MRKVRRMQLLSPKWATQRSGQSGIETQRPAQKDRPCQMVTAESRLVRRALRGSCRLRLRPTGQFRAIKRKEIDGINVQRREATVARHIRDDPAHKGEQQSRTFDQQERVQLFLRHALNVEN